VRGAEGPVQDEKRARRRLTLVVASARLSLVKEPPETRYVDVGGAKVAYQVVGNGPLDLLYLELGQIDLRWDHPRFADFFTRLASFSRLILFDRRGTGASDRLPHDDIPTWEDWAEDARAVLDAAGAGRAAIVAVADAGPIGILLAAMDPARVGALVLDNTSARFMVDDDYPIGLSAEVVESIVALFETTWATEDFVRMIVPDAMADDTEYLRFLGKQLRAVATPQMVGALYRYMMESTDVRSVLPLIQVPVLVFHNDRNPVIPIEHGRYLAEHLPGAKFIEVASDGAAFDSTEPDFIAEVCEFLTGERPAIEVDRILTTLLFTDIVGSTGLAASLGDERWRSVLDAHDRAVRDQLRRFRGREINTTGDGFLVSFDGPARAIRCARAITGAVRELGIEVRAGLHTGECEVRGDDLGGLAVHIVARVGAHAGPSEVLVSSTVRLLVAGSAIELEDRGDHELKGVPDTWRLFAVENA